MVIEPGRGRENVGVLLGAASAGGFAGTAQVDDQYLESGRGDLPAGVVPVGAVGVGPMDNDDTGGARADVGRFERFSVGGLECDGLGTHRFGGG